MRNTQFVGCVRPHIASQVSAPFFQTVKVQTAQPYEIYIGQEILHTVGGHAATLVSGRTAAIITDDIVFGLYEPKVKSSLENAGFTVYSFVFDNGEASKNMQTLSSALEFLAKNKLTRSDIIIALGGGVVGDLAGFTAACYLRGVKYIQVPTTLLAQVDSSVGGKTAVDLESGKNLAGAFWQPAAVVCDIDTLDTLTENILEDGMAEVIKYGVLFDADLFGMTDSFEVNKINIITKCIEHKRDIVEQDECDIGVRQLLNLGHTIGHAIEKLSEYQISHGQAVAIGMVMITRGSFHGGHCWYELITDLEQALSRWHLPARCEYSAKSLCEAALSDKKRQGEKITLVLPEEIGKCMLKEYDVNDLYAFIKLCKGE